MLRSDESETAEPQKESLRDASCGQPKERTSVAVSERAQQKDCFYVSAPFMKEVGNENGEGGRGKNVLNPAPASPSQHSSNTR